MPALAAKTNHVASDDIRLWGPETTSDSLCRGTAIKIAQGDASLPIIYLDRIPNYLASKYWVERNEHFQKGVKLW